jgi:riboflavin kinase/FMN adenylyltransferase
MNFRQLLASLAPGEDTVVTVGVFDGVHLGHRHLLGRLVELGSPSLIPAVLTFNNHPITVLQPETHVGCLTSSAQKTQLIKNLGIDLVVGLDFTWELSQVSAQEFAAALCDCLHMKGLVLGPDTALGRNRQGDPAFLRQLGEQMGFWVESAEALAQDGTAVRSRQIRAGLSRGDVAAAARMLGRNFSLNGEVVVGDRRGRTLGFPTANLALDGDLALPLDGIYATWAVVDGRRHGSATNVGVRPTFGGQHRIVEAYLLDFDEDLYGKRLTLKFVRRLRDELDFPDIGSLVEQMKLDVDDARSVLKGFEDPIGAPVSGDLEGRG